MKFSVAVTSVRGFEKIEPLFKTSSPDAEIVIVDPNYNEKTKEKLEQLNHAYCKVTYAPKWNLETKIDENSIFKYLNDKNRCRNNAIAYCEGDWIYRLDDSTEFCPYFFRILEESINTFTQHLGNTNFVIRPVKLESWMGHKKWDNLPSLDGKDGRYFELNRRSYFETLDQFIATRESLDALNGMDEQYDVGHGDDDRDILQRFISFGHKIFLDKDLKTYQIGHKRNIDPIPFTKWLYDVKIVEIANGGKYYAFNPYNIKKLREQLLKEKDKYTLETPLTIAPITNISSFVPQEPPNHFIGEYPLKQYFLNNDWNEQKINLMKDMYKGQDVFLLGNSRSITKEFIDKVRDKTTFAANGFIACRDHWNFEPTYFVVTDPGVLDPHMVNTSPEFTIDGESLDGKSEYDLLIKAKTAKFVLSDLIIKPFLFGNFNRKDERIEWLEKNVHIKGLNKEELTPPFMISPKSPIIENISFDLQKGTFMYGTIITDLMIPLAVWMGFKNIYLKGCSGGPGKFFTNEIDDKHFWELEYQKRIYQDIYALFKQKLDEIGVNIYNLDSPHDIEVEGQWVLGKGKYVIPYADDGKIFA